MFDGFEGYRTPTPERYESVLTSGLVIPDANVLLNLYRYNTQTREDLFRVLARLGDRLWVPHQVVVEFWRNRESASRDLQDTADRTIASLEKLREQSSSELQAWLNRIALPGERRATMRLALEGAFDNLVEEIAELVNSEALEQIGDTNRDPVLLVLEGTLSSRVGDPFDPEEYDHIVSEGRRRLGDEVPPGYKDKTKSGDHNLATTSFGKE
ncbi:MAG: hypothetical protein IPK24_23985 [Kineosporiaceae bacterium]|nr:hypothetical protein [Kineosporiaceae bacterium]